MRTSRFASQFMIFLLAAFPLLATHFSDFYVIPVASHIAGANSTAWRTDISIHNFQSSPITVELALVESGEGLLDNVFTVLIGGASSITIPPGGNRVLPDVLQNHREKAQVSGAILIGADKPFAVTSRSYNVTASGDTIGQTVPPAQDFADPTSRDQAGATAYLPGLASNARFRSNLGFLAGTSSASAQPLTIEVTISGAEGSLSKKTFTVGPGVFTHLQFSVRTITSTNFDAGSATVRVTGGEGTVVTYASVVDNATADGSFIQGGSVASTIVSKSLFALFRSRLGSTK